MHLQAPTRVSSGSWRTNGIMSLSWQRWRHSSSAELPIRPAVALLALVYVFRPLSRP